jgi:ATP-binding cassette subfamily F protein uup
MDQREYDQIEEKILELEERLEEVQQLMTDPDVMADQVRLQQSWQEQQALQAETDRLYDRWNELEQRKQDG